MPDSKLTFDKMYDAAQGAFDELATTFDNTPGELADYPVKTAAFPDGYWGYPANYWQFGCSFDSMLDFVRMSSDVDKAVSDKSVSKLLDNALSVREQAEPYLSCWYDDYGWWGIASSKVFDDDYSTIFSDNTKASDSFRQVAVHCWDIMNSGKPKDHFEYPYHGAPHAWANRDAPKGGRKGPAPSGGFFDNPNDKTNWAKPRIDGGCWQYDLFSEKRDKYPGGAIVNGLVTSQPITGDPLPKPVKVGEQCTIASSYPSKPATCGLGPFQDTVVNGLYFVLAQRLQEAMAAGQKVPGFKDATDEIHNEHTFLAKWMAVTPTDEALQSPDGLIRERVSTYAALPDGSHPNVQKYSPDAFWAGDQGLVMGGFLQHSTQDHDNDYDRGWKVACGAVQSLVDGENRLKSTSDVWEVGDANDYKSGVGIFWRYVYYAFGKSGDNAFRDNVLADSHFLDVVEASVKDALSATPTFHMKKNEMWNHFNVMSTLTTGIQILLAAGRIHLPTESA